MHIIRLLSASWTYFFGVIASSKNIAEVMLQRCLAVKSVPEGPALAVSIIWGGSQLFVTPVSGEYNAFFSLPWEIAHITYHTYTHTQSLCLSVLLSLYNT